MLISAGIDEAGYGPILGPLVTALAAFESDGDDLWRALRSVTRRRAPRGGLGTRLPVVDSKELYRGGAGLAELETVALAFSAFAAEADLPPTGRAFVERHRAGEPLPLERYPWYQALDALALPLCADAALTLAARDRLAHAAAARGVRAVRLAIAPILEMEFNERAERHGSKAHLLFELNVTLIDDLRARTDFPLRVLCDRHGGRRQYQDLIHRAFPFEAVAVEHEDRDRSSYRVTGRGAEVRLAYVVGGERQGFEVALASILAKYTRELFMEVLNRYFAARVEGIARTAGYYTDGLRFLDELERAAALDPGERRRLVRRR
jgi:ribonuclease HII